MNKHLVFLKVLLISCGMFSLFPHAQAAIALDRTRAIFPGTEKAISLNISNENKKQPYLAQAWLENSRGEKINSPFAVVPPLQRVEAGKKSVIRITATPEAKALPQDRESVFYFSMREIPPRSDKPNVMQVALQTKVKLFYRPESIIPEKMTRWDDQLVLHKIGNGYRVENPTPYYMTVIGIAGAEKQAVAKDFEAIMIEPKSSVNIKSQTFSAPHVTTINDFGGKPTLAFRCSGDICRADVNQR
ncbi:Chaperone protein papD precursor [Serratia entomophila]|uniref:SefD n=3 Tax=Serratia TaxID=613 RepID=Q7BQT6_9GAMM|nr:SefD [Serratia entomophila]ULG13468.1 SefD [Serratia proteamaculans]CAI1208494.1 Chaperone protein papD precursor [Serratia quinivorans]ULG10331.1 SefD [Serratia entomophila]ULG10610.1 SefD [Serratia entomophila]